MDKPLGRTDEIPFRFYFYFGTSFNKTCIHLKQNDRTDAQSRLVELMNEGAVCYRKDFAFEGGTTVENRENAFYWQHFWKIVGQMKTRVKPDQYTVGIEILNHGLRRKVGFTRKISEADFQKARRFATQNRTFFPLPHYLLPEGQNPGFKKYEL
ncbi:hypothetical protein Fcan01_09925 [Folsomia candida]|uniref:Uncharacterized protein n=1 Tax=Folsomia candida TaxID=158441 RepID=A0A226ED99_FOLCA|nr:hypothetical protein Fcan01_09925 [Folsomia candida]